MRDQVEPGTQPRRQCGQDREAVHPPRFERRSDRAPLSMDPHSRRLGYPPLDRLTRGPERKGKVAGVVAGASTHFSGLDKGRTGGEGGIRTHGELAPTTVFET